MDDELIRTIDEHLAKYNYNRDQRITIINLMNPDTGQDFNDELVSVLQQWGHKIGKPPQAKVPYKGSTEKKRTTKVKLNEEQKRYYRRKYGKGGKLSWQ